MGAMWGRACSLSHVPLLLLRRWLNPRSKHVPRCRTGGETPLLADLYESAPRWHVVPDGSMVTWSDLLSVWGEFFLSSYSSTA